MVFWLAGSAKASAQHATQRQTIGILIGSTRIAHSLTVPLPESSLQPHPNAYSCLAWSATSVMTRLMSLKDFPDHIVRQPIALKIIIVSTSYVCNMSPNTQGPRPRPQGLTRQAQRPQGPYGHRANKAPRSQGLNAKAKVVRATRPKPKTQGPKAKGQGPCHKAQKGQGSLQGQNPQGPKVLIRPGKASEGLTRPHKIFQGLVRPHNVL